MKEVGAYQAKTHLSELLEMVEKGEPVTITKYGSPVALMTQPPAKKKQDPGAVIEAIRAYRGKAGLDSVVIESLMEQAGRL